MNTDNPAFIQALPEQVQTDAVGPTFTIDLDYARPPITANDRTHWRRKADLTRRLRRAAAEAAKQHRIPEYPRIRVSLVWVVRDRRRRDGGENIAPTLKPLIDGLVDAGVVSDDDQHHVIRDMPTIRYEQGSAPHLELTIAPVYPEAVAA